MSLNPHRHHRSRMKQRFLLQGLDSFAPHEQIELLLFYAIPQGDVNELAHELLNRFGSLAGICSAKQEELLAVPGIGEHAALLFSLIPQLTRAYLESAAEPVEQYQDITQIGELLVRRYLGVEREEVYLLLFDAQMHLLSCAPISAGTVTLVNLQPRMLLEPAYAARAACAVLAHNHPGGIAVPSRDDLCLTAELAESLSRAGMPLLEHIIVAGTRYTPMLMKQNLRAGNPAAAQFLADFYSGITAADAYSADLIPKEPIV